MIFIPFIIFFALLFGYFFYKHYSQKLARNLALKKLSEKKPAWKEFLRDETKLFSQLSQQEQERLLDSILIFYSEKKWSTELSENECLKTSYYACLPIFKRKTNYYPNIKEINSMWSFQEWLSQNEKQFEIDFGKLALKELRGNFSYYSELFFESPNKLQTDHPAVYDKLLKFYQVEV